MGSACLFFNILPESAVLGDLNHDVVNVYERIKEDPAKLYKLAHEYPLGKDAYYDVRSMYKLADDPFVRASMFIYLNRFCFNGLYRTNLKGEFNVPYGGGRSGQLPTLECLSNISSALKDTQIVCGDFEQVVLDSVDARTFVYMDPPYAVTNRRVFRQYCPSVFGLDDLARLSALLDVINARGGYFLLSYAHSPEADTFFSKWHKTEANVQRNIAGFAKNRKVDSELMITNLI